MTTLTAPPAKTAPVYVDVLPATRSCKHRAVSWCPDHSELTITAKKVQRYTLREFRPDRGYGPGRAFKLTKGDGTTYHLFVGPDGSSCDCAGCSYEASGKADRRHGDGGFGTKGCSHLDATECLLRNGWLDRPTRPARVEDDELPACFRDLGPSGRARDGVPF
jgi:hypothetical protein